MTPQDAAQLARHLHNRIATLDVPVMPELYRRTLRFAARLSRACEALCGPPPGHAAALHQSAATATVRIAERLRVLALVGDGPRRDLRVAQRLCARLTDHFRVCDAAAASAQCLLPEVA